MRILHKCFIVLAYDKENAAVIRSYNLVIDCVVPTQSIAKISILP